MTSHGNVIQMCTWYIGKIANMNVRDKILAIGQAELFPDFIAACPYVPLWPKSGDRPWSIMKIMEIQINGHEIVSIDLLVELT